MRERSQSIAVHGRILVGELFAGRVHARGEPLLDLAALAGEEFPRLVDDLGIGRSVDAADARRRATLDLVLKTWPRARREHGVGAGAERERALQHRERLVHGAGGGERSEILVALDARAAVLVDA